GSQGVPGPAAASLPRAAERPSGPDALGLLTPAGADTRVGVASPRTAKGSGGPCYRGLDVVAGVAGARRARAWSAKVLASSTGALTPPSWCIQYWGWGGSGPFQRASGP